MNKQISSIKTPLKPESSGGFAVLGLDQFLQNLDYARREYESAARKGARQVGSFMVGKVKQELNKEGTGRTYYRVRGSSRKKYGYFTERGRSLPFGDEDYVVHVASAPGEPPAPDWGMLRASIRYELEDYNTANNTVVLVGTNIKYGRGNRYSAAIFEFGTHKMAPRPFLAKTIRANWNEGLQFWAHRFRKIKNTGRR